ncbi:MAG: hypothetical protein GW803_06625 [Caldiserica bacterium]|nr:hypothetical protein [Caldisericota bacterium]NCQ53715.1 hypothetical protein [Caldisericota bacterium]
MDRKIIKIIKWFLLLSLIFSSLYLFNYSYFKGNNGMFFLNALDSAGGSCRSFSFDVDSLSWFMFRTSLQASDHFGRLRCPSYMYKTPYTDPIYFDNGKREGCWVDFWYLNLENCPSHPSGKPFFRSNSAIVFYYVLTPDDYKIIESFQNTKRVPYLKSIALQIKTMPTFITTELRHLSTDQIDTIIGQMPMLFLTVLFSIPYLFIQVVIPPSLSIPFFWLWVAFSIFYIVTPHRILKRIGEKVKGLLHKRSNN